MNIDDIIRKIWDTQGFGNVAVWPDGTMTVVSGDYTGEPDGKKPLAVLKPIPLVASTPCSIMPSATRNSGRPSGMPSAVPPGPDQVRDGGRGPRSPGSLIR